MTAMFTTDDLEKGRRFIVQDGMTITPQPSTVEIVWVGPKDVDYRKNGGLLVRTTPIERFLEIVNKIVK